MFVVGLILVIVTALFSWSFISGTDYMIEDEIDVDDSDFLTSAGRDGWDDNSVHSEGDF